MTLLLAWSAEEAGRIIETYKIFERKPPDLIMEKQESNSLSKVCTINVYSFLIVQSVLALQLLGYLN